MRGKLENKTGRSSNFRDYRLLLDGSFNFLLLIYLMQREHTLHTCLCKIFKGLQQDKSFCCMSRVLNLYMCDVKASCGCVGLGWMHGEHNVLQLIAKT